MKKKQYTHVPAARIFFNGVEQSPTLQERIKILTDCGAPTQKIQKLANDYDGYIQIKMMPIT